MPGTTATLLCQHGQEFSACAMCRKHKQTHADLIANLDALLAAARPRLLRLARLNGVSPDATDDIVQETLFEAWHHLSDLREPQRFDAWLDGICRNVCKRQLRFRGTDTLQQVRLPDPASDDHSEDFETDIPDPLAFDPVEELGRQDLAVLLDRALAYLPGETRQIVEMCYLAELPQREAALQLGMTIGALELRLHRARRQLRQLLNGELRTEAEPFGLLDAEPSTGWRETRQWCWLCGKQRMRGIFEQQPDGIVSLRLRCPDCSVRYDMDITNSAGLVSIGDLRSFRPAIKRLLTTIPNLCISALHNEHCLRCKTTMRVSVLSSAAARLAYPSALMPPDRFWLITDCTNCGICATDIASALASHPALLSFAEQHERFITEPCELVPYADQLAICARFSAMSSARRLIIIAHPQTLQTLATFFE